MNGICRYAAVGCLLLFIASAGFAQMYTVTDITSPTSRSEVSGINNIGQVVGNDWNLGGFRTAPNSPMNPATDLIGAGKWVTGVNDLGQVIGVISNAGGQLAFSTAPNSLVPFVIGGSGTTPTGINASGQVTVVLSHGTYFEAFRTAPNTAVNPATDNLGAFPSASQAFTWAEDINDAGQVVGGSGALNHGHAFRTTPNSPIKPGTDDLGTLGGSSSWAGGINNFGQAVGSSYVVGDAAIHAFRTAPNRSINPATDDLGPGGANAINDYGEVVGTDWGPCDPNESCDSWYGFPFLHSSGIRHDLTQLIAPLASGCVLSDAIDINNGGQIAANIFCGMDDQGSPIWRAVLLTAIYKASVQAPIKGDGSSVFPIGTGVVQVKFNLSRKNSRTCTLPPATIAVTNAAGGAIALQANNTVNGGTNTFMPLVDKGPNFRISACQYVYNLGVFSFSRGTYRVDISIKNVFVGHAVFTLK